MAFSPQPELVRTADALREALARARSRGLRVGFVPTMGALHRGHLRLVDEARHRAAYTAVSIFVNPTQFGPNEDLARYPRDLESDLSQCAAADVDLVFAPEMGEMYPPGDTTRVRVGALGETLCGPFRPGHFEGVATIVAKLFALLTPCVAVFGRKDFQQLKIIERMARDLLFDVEIVGVSTERDADGLALSSRNAYLSADERERARAIPRALGQACSAFAAGERRAGALRAMAVAEVTALISAVDYIALTNPATLVPIDDGAILTGPALLAIAVRLGKTRLIDNVVLGEDRCPGAEAT
ncbi:MAG TPA: pantoate--beta-alanine ligase [Polyangiaceae bacterium]